MKILFLTIENMGSIETHGIYSDLLRCFRDKGHRIYTVSPNERRTGLGTNMTEENGVKMLRVSTGNITKCGIIEKGISTLMIEQWYLTAIKKYLSNVKFDLVLYSTPPVTLTKVIQYIKKHDGARTYLLLKDIFPQNAVDLGMLSKKGLRGLLYRYFRRKEKKLYAVSDYIGCMSQANVDYLLQYNRDISADKVEVCPNCIEIQDMRLSDDEKVEMRLKYGIPCDKKVFVYGGNLGRPQGIEFIVECLKSQEKNKDVFFLIVGDGTEFGYLEKYFSEVKPTNMKLMKTLPREDYDRMIAACDIGMIFLDYRFTIPNFPSRLLTYMQARLPVLACTDINTDIGKVILDGGFGWWCESNNVTGFGEKVNEVLKSNITDMKNNSYRFLSEHYCVDIGYKLIIKDV